MLQQLTQTQRPQRRIETLLGLALGVLVGIGLTIGQTEAGYIGATDKPTADPTLTPYLPMDDVSGRLTVAGSTTMQPLMAKLAAEFTRHHPGVKVSVEGGGSSAAIREFVLGYSQQRRGEKSRDGHINGAAKASVLASSRELTSAELKAFVAANGYEPLMIAVATDAVAIYVHADNPIQGLTLKQVDAIFGTDRKRGLSEDITTWGQLGLANSWEQQPIHLFGRDKMSGTMDFFKHVALLNGEFKEGTKEFQGAASEILAIARDPLGIGYAGVGIQSSYVRAVPLVEQEGRPYVAPRRGSVMDETYPLRRTLYLYANTEPKSDLNSAIVELLKFINSREGQETVAKAGFYPLLPDQVAKNLSVITGGTATASLPVSGS
jgi:phosphate transport system substrate-binding protein